MAGWDREHALDHDPGREIDVDPEVENTSDEIETEVDRGEMNLHPWVLDDMIAGTIFNITF